MPACVRPLVVVVWCATLAGCGAATSHAPTQPKSAAIAATSIVSTQPKSAATAPTSTVSTQPKSAAAAPAGQTTETISEVAGSATADRPAVRSIAMPAPLMGYLDMSGCPPTATLERVAGVLGGCVVYVDWAHLEPVRRVFDFAAIELQLDRVRAWNANRTTNLIGLRVRVLIGARSPAWAIDIGGPHVSINLCGPNGTLPACAEHRNEAVPRFWTAEFGVAYAELLVALDARYGNEPELRDLAINRCTTIFRRADGPHVRPGRQPPRVAQGRVQRVTRSRLPEGPQSTPRWRCCLTPTSASRSPPTKSRPSATAFTRPATPTNGRSN